MQQKFYVDLQKLPSELESGIKEISETAGISFVNSEDFFEIEFLRSGNGINISFSKKIFSIEYGDLTDAFRALGLIKARIDKPATAVLRQSRRMKKIFVMLDVSRNAVLNMDSSVQWLHFMALAGVNGFMFYTEDTFEIPGEAFFGYLRGRLSADEIKKLDAVAASLGIEMIPCIQTLAHLERILVYEQYADIKDTESVMLCDSEATTEFIAKMIRAASAPYRSKRIHIGMDEAWDLGRGRYLDKFGWKKSSEIVTRHLERIMEILRRENLQPMMWADMFFRALPGGEGYYGKGLKLESMQETYKGKVAEDIQLIYWDYYHFDKNDYTEMFLKHEAINNHKAIFAPAVHQPRRFWPSAPYTEKSVNAGLECCFENGVEEMIITIWGDEGMECDCFASLAWVQYIADIVYTGSESTNQTQCNLKGNSGFDFSDFRYAGSIDVLPFLAPDHYPNISRTLFWENPFLGTIQAQLEGESLNPHYREVSEKLDVMRRKKGNERLEIIWRVADILADKSDLPTLLMNAYMKKDLDALGKISENISPMLRRKIAELKSYHRELWLKNYKPFGWEVLEARYSTLLGLFEHLEFRVKSFLDGASASLPELEEKHIKIFQRPKEMFPHLLYKVLRDIPSSSF